MSHQDEVLREMRRIAGMPIESQAEEVVVIQPKRDAKFALKEARDLAGLNDYQDGTDLT